MLLNNHILSLSIDRDARYRIPHSTLELDIPHGQNPWYTHVMLHL
jgi:hypothetical protein